MFMIFFISVASWGLYSVLLFKPFLSEYVGVACPLLVHFADSDVSCILGPNRTSDVPNLMQMRGNSRFFSLALESANDKFDV